MTQRKGKFTIKTFCYLLSVLFCQQTSFSAESLLLLLPLTSSHWKDWKLEGGISCATSWCGGRAAKCGGGGCFDPDRSGRKINPRWRWFVTWSRLFRFKPDLFFFAQNLSFEHRWMNLWLVVADEACSYGGLQTRVWVLLRPYKRPSMMTRFLSHSLCHVLRPFGASFIDLFGLFKTLI